MLKHDGFPMAERLRVTTSPHLFIAILNKSPSDGFWQVLTPQVMRWTDEVWLMDLSSCYSYWESQASDPQEGIMGVIRRVLERVCPDGFVAVASEYPWCAVLLLSYMRERGLSGLVHIEGTFGQALYQKVTWPAFWSVVEELSPHYGKAFPKQWRSESFQRRCTQMRHAMRKLGVKLPHSLRDMDPYAIRRRYGATLRDVWYWTFFPKQGCPDVHSIEGDTQIGAFPWESYQPVHVPSVVRHLDYPITEWAQVEPLLCLDLAKLCVQDTWNCREKVTCLEWRLTLDDMSTMYVPIHFRHPHSLHLESPQFPTARLQANYSFHRFAKGDLSLEGGENVSPPPIISWSLAVPGRLLMPPQVMDIFGSADDSESRLLELENRLPILLQRYAARADWQPEDAFSAERSSEIVGTDPHAISPQSWLATARVRPLLIYKKPQPFERQPVSAAWQFLERSMCKWWQPKNDRNLQRDYYRMVDHQQHACWVFKDAAGRWYRHGIFS